MRIFKKIFFMNKGLKFAVIFVILILIGKSINKGTKGKRIMILEAINKKYGSKRAEKFAKVFDALQSLNLSELQFNFALAQIMQETGVFITEGGVFDKNTNASGISWSGSPAQLATGATKGTLRPKKEGGNYAKYPNLSSWAKDYMRVLNKGSFPLKAITPDNFVDRLAVNKYFDTDPVKYPNAVKDYKRNVNTFYKLITNV